MSKSTDNIITKSKEDFKNQFMVAFLGEKFSGKTITCALIKDALTRHYTEYSKGEYIGISTDGSKRMNMLMDELTNGKFPAKTLLAEATPMTLEIISTKEGSKIDIVLRDMAGEKRKDLLEADDFPNVEARLNAIFKTAIIEGKDYGLLTHVVFAKIYIIIIDCSKFHDDNKLRMEDSYIKDTIRHLFDIKEKIGELTNNRIHDPIAFVFTKYDQLSEEKQKPPGELIKELPEVRGALTRYHMGDVAYFKSSVVSDKISDEEIELAISKKQSSENEDLKEAENNVNDMIVKKADIKKELDVAEGELNTAKQNLVNVKPTNNLQAINEAQANVNEAESEAKSLQEAYDEITVQLDSGRKRLSDIKEQLETNPPKTAEELGISKYKPRKPLSYSLDDYLQLIAWIIKMNKQIRGYPITQ